MHLAFRIVSHFVSILCVLVWPVILLLFFFTLQGGLTLARKYVIFLSLFFTSIKLCLSLSLFTTFIKQYVFCCGRIYDMMFLHFLQLSILLSTVSTIKSLKYMMLSLQSIHAHTHYFGELTIAEWIHHCWYPCSMFRIFGYGLYVICAVIILRYKIKHIIEILIRKIFSFMSILIL